ncbi:molybdate ABC transporter substrate-binding protein [Tepidibacter hydrothermalis]|uniref:Molybdate ABC transporter substrate-binding protein n=1 Tax=Tepidibacter hydrothermalis TaxID=3036126 RepID=A0ABY8ECG4_9FIRM|nr:molybdate ABC transporter substrate-binding protein [Tepidibacter hydrothermalis]WFD10627.1 molybdate ABC transporter substrate-binding protein [Tepidibacter hydrothermalis]
MRKSFFCLILLIFITIGSVGCNNKKVEKNNEITVFAASSMTESMEEIKQEFEKNNPDIKIVLNLDSSSRLRTQIENGVKPDIFISANEKHCKLLQEKGITDNKEQLLNNSMVLIVPSDNPCNIENLNDLRNKCDVVIAQKEVPAGDYALRILDNLNDKYGKDYKDSVLKNVVSEENNVKQVVTKVVLKEAQAAFVYSSDVTNKIKDKVKVIDIPKEYNVNATYWSSVFNDNEECLKFYEYLKGDQGKIIFKKYGFEPYI